MEPMKLEPLPASSLPPAVAGLARGAAPAKLMVVRGMAPLRPSDLVVAAYQLSFDTDAAVKAAAEAAPAKLPEKMLLGPLSEALPPPVLHFFAERLPPERSAAIEKILYNQGAADETFVHLAKVLDESRLEIIFQNEVRLLRCPALVEALYFNKRARMSSVSRALELCARNGVMLAGIPGFDQIAAAVATDPSALQPSASDEDFATAATDGAAVPEVSQAGPGEQPASPGSAAGADEAQGKKKSAIIKFDELKIFEKVRLATVGNAYCRQVLIRDTNRIVAMAVIRSPSITDMEVVAAAANRSVCDDVIRFIANSRVYTKDYAVKQALVNNPKCPLASSLRLLAFLHPDDLRALSRSKNVPGALSGAAKKLLDTRGKSGGG